MAATYDPDPEAPHGFRVPFNLETGELLPQRWRRWLRHDPVDLVARYARNLRTLRGIYIDCGWRDQYHIHYGSRMLSQRLAEQRVSARLRGVRRHALRRRLPHGPQPAVSLPRVALSQRGPRPDPRVCTVSVPARPASLPAGAELLQTSLQRELVDVWCSRRWRTRVRRASGHRKGATNENAKHRAPACAGRHQRRRAAARNRRPPEHVVLADPVVADPR